MKGQFKKIFLCRTPLVKEPGMFHSAGFLAQKAHILPPVGGLLVHTMSSLSSLPRFVALSTLWPCLSILKHEVKASFTNWPHGCFSNGFSRPLSPSILSRTRSTLRLPSLTMAQHVVQASAGVISGSTNINISSVTGQPANSIKRDGRPRTIRPLDGIAAHQLFN